MGLSTEIRKKLIETFKTEQSEHVQNINQGLLALEKAVSNAERQPLLNDIFREAHSLKGAARSVGMTSIESLGHGLEDILLRIKNQSNLLSADLFDLLYQVLDAIELMLVRVEAGDSTPPAKVLMLMAQLEEVAASLGDAPVEHLIPEQAPGQQPSIVAESQSEPDMVQPGADDGFVTSEQELRAPPALPSSLMGQNETIRVSVNKLDALMAQFSELLGAKIRADQRLIEVKEQQQLAVRWQKEWANLRSHYGRLIRSGYANNDGATKFDKDVSALIAFVGRNQDNLKSFSGHTNLFYRKLSNDTMRLSLIIDELQEEIKRVRMQPLSTIATTFGRLVRDLAREQGKEISLLSYGEDTELDKRVLEQIKDPLIHLLRNAVDHGLETPAERQAAGKAAAGQITLAASQQGNNVIITVSDNGRGLDIDAVRQSAVRKGLVTAAEAEQLSRGEVANLIFSSGLSTSKIITDISGRGVGMDVVRQNVENLHGMLEVDFEAGRRTTFTMILPLTLASSRGLLVRVGSQTFALPLTTVERMVHVNPADIVSVEGKEAITYQDKAVALGRLSQMLDLPDNQNEAQILIVVIITVAEKRLGLVVDELLGEQEIVMKNLGPQLPKVGGFAGATVLGSGQVILVLHPADLVKLATQAHKPTKLSDRQQDKLEQKTILVVDDSITTRTLEKNILEGVGYQVKLATNGEEALTMLLADALPNLIVSDVNMPRLDGFELTQRIKQDSRFSTIPVILVTSLDSPADKARGIDVGADAYIVKSSFDQGNLLDTIEQLA